MAKAFSELSEREILALAISLEEDDVRIYGDYADRLRADYPDTAKLLKTMQDEELVHAQRLIASYRAQFGEHIPFVQRQDVKGFLRRKPLWLAKMLSVQQVRKEIEVMEAESMRFYQTAAKRTTNLSVRQLLDELAAAEQAHEDLAGKLKTDLEESGARKRGSNPPADVCSSGYSTGSGGTHGWFCLDVGSRLCRRLCHAGQLGCLPGRHGRFHRRWY